MSAKGVGAECTSTKAGPREGLKPTFAPKSESWPAWVYDPYSWAGGARTMPTAHDYITKNFDTLKSGAVIDVEFITGETNTPRPSDRFFTV
jgi:hypothetical protein